MPKIEFYSKYDDYNNKNEEFNKILEEISNFLSNLDNLNQIEIISSSFTNLKENYLKENIVKCLFDLKQIAVFLNFTQLKDWVNLELNGYSYKCSYIPQYRRFLEVYFFGDTQYSFRDDILILDPLGEVLRRIENKEDYNIELNDDERLVFFQIYDKNVDKLVIFCSNLTQIVYGIKQILFKFISILGSKISLSLIKTHSFWSKIHSEIVKASQKLFNDKHYAEAVFSAFKEVNNRIKDIYKNKTEIELDGKNLMLKAFNLSNPIVKFNDCQTETERNIQEGYMHLCAGSIQGIRNPKAHENIKIDKNRAVHFLYLASLLMYKVDEAIP